MANGTRFGTSQPPFLVETSDGRIESLIAPTDPLGRDDDGEWRSGRLASALSARQWRAPGSFAGGGDEDVRPAAGVSRRTGGERADGRGSGGHRLGLARPALGRGDARVHAGSA